MFSAAMAQSSRVRLRKAGEISSNAEPLRTPPASASTTLEASTPGAIRARVRAMRGSPGLRAIRNFNDSGASSHNRAATISGPIPPTRKIPRQPKRWITGGARKPALKAPRAIAAFIDTTARER